MASDTLAFPTGRSCSTSLGGRIKGAAFLRIGGQASGNIVGFNEQRATLVATHIPLIGAGID
jgi:hypothetical protein